MVETRFVGEKEMGVAGAEIVDVKDRVVDVAAPGPTCPVGTGKTLNCCLPCTWGDAVPPLSRRRTKCFALLLVLGIQCLTAQQQGGDPLAVHDPLLCLLQTAQHSAN